ncbi:MAG: S-layer homology domain-containing protein [Anaerovoracaceae bacterium]|jgi:hypothetical protein
MRVKEARRAFTILLALLFAASIFFMSAVPSFAYIERGSVIIGDPGTTVLNVGESTTMSISPYEEQHLPGCGMADCPAICGEKNCIIYINGQPECTCEGTELQTYYAEVSPTSSDESVATASYDGKGNVVITAVGAGTCQISVSASFREYTSASKTINLTVNGTDSGSGDSGTGDSGTGDSGDSSGSTTYGVTVQQPSVDGCSVTADKTTAAEGDTVTLTATAAEGYTVDSVTVTTADGSSIAVSGSNGSYTFTMPASAVTVTAVFKEESTSDTDTLPFTDISADRWSRSAIAYAYNNGLFMGTSATEFSPEIEMSRAMLVSVLYRLEGSPSVSGDQPFSDVSSDAYYASAVEWASENGIAAGTSSETFDPDSSVTREQFATFLYRYAQYKNYSTTGTADLSGFSDSADVGSYAEAAVEWAVSEGIISGTDENMLLPKAGTTREQAASMLMRFITAETSA